ncbi:MAG: hypothetical protein FWE63_05775 [Bacteroidales bacterium]|nr:hypothetical protein [Bacteroidales bacterium]
MKKIFLISTFFIGSTLFNSCNKVEIPEEIIKKTIVKDETRDAIRTLIADLYGRENLSFSEIKSAVCQKFGIDEKEVRITENSIANVSDAALSVVDKLSAIDGLDFSTHREYLFALDNVLENSRGVLTDAEYTSLLISLYITSDILDEIGINSKSGWWNRWGRCAAGIIGGATIGALGGAGIAAIPTAGIGAPVGAIIGGIGGGLLGASGAC